MGERHVAAHALRRRACPTSAARASGNRDGTRSRRATSRRRASRSRRSPPSRRCGSRRRSRPTTGPRSSPSSSRSSSPTHEWLYRERDPDRCGLVTLIHPWECGLDTTPPWMQALARMPVPWWARAATRFHLAHARAVPPARHASTSRRSSVRPTTRACACSCSRSSRSVTASSCAACHADRSVLIQDLAFNAILAAANRSSTAIAAELDTALPPELPDHFARTTAALEELWDDDTGEYYSRDAVTGELLAHSDHRHVPPAVRRRAHADRAHRLLARLRAPDGFWPRFPVPTVPTDAPEFRDEAYWKGPTWLNMNWMIVEALDEHGEHDLADRLRRALTRAGRARGMPRVLLADHRRAATAPPTSRGPPRSPSTSSRTRN